VGHLFISDVWIVMFFDDIFLVYDFYFISDVLIAMFFDDLYSRAFICLLFFLNRFSLSPFIDFVLLVDGFPLLLYIYRGFSSMWVDML
jgi:hypothetical protein